MKKVVLLAAVSICLLLSFNCWAQEPLLSEGTQELGLSGNLDFEGPAGGVDVDLEGSYGYFIKDNLEVGAFANFSRELDGDVMSYGLGAFLEQHFLVYPELATYIGLNAGLQFVDVDFDEDESSLFSTGRLGIKWFIRDYFAIDANIFLTLATDDIFVNDEDLDDYDVGALLGLRVYFR